MATALGGHAKPVRTLSSCPRKAVGMAPRVRRESSRKRITRMRIVSLISSATEILCALGLGDRLVGRSHECDFPEWVQSLPACTMPKFDVSGSSADIDRRVKD